VGLRGLPVGFSILAGACLNLVLLSVLKGHIRMLMIISSVLMTAGCGSLAVAEVNNMYQLWGLLILAGIGIGGKIPFRRMMVVQFTHFLIIGIVVPASIITTIICPDDLIATVRILISSARFTGHDTCHTPQRQLSARHRSVHFHICGQITLSIIIH